MLFTKLNTTTKIILAIQCIGMLSGTATHLLWVIHNGFLSENYNVPLLSRIFWDSLTFLDPIAAILLITKPKAGVWLTAIILIVDVFHNSLVCYNSPTCFNELISGPFDVNRWVGNNWMLLCQIAFGLFVILTLKNNLREIKLKSRPA